MLVASPALSRVDRVLDVVGDRVGLALYVSVATCCPARDGGLIRRIDLAHHRITIETIGDLEGVPFCVDDGGVLIHLLDMTTLQIAPGIVPVKGLVI